jgi:hypothetical protein
MFKAFAETNLKEGSPTVTLAHDTPIFLVNFYSINEFFCAFARPLAGCQAQM